MAGRLTVVTVQRVGVALIGMRGVGKSNISRRLGFLTKCPVLSTDVLATYESGLSIPDLVAAQGWPAFRDLEHHIVARLTALPTAIIDCGGGIVVDLADGGNECFSERNVARLRQLGPVVWLRGDVARLVAKTAADPNRPTLDERQDALAMMARRQPWYESAADVIIDVEGRKRSHIAVELALQFAAELGLDPALVADISAKNRT